MSPLICRNCGRPVPKDAPGGNMCPACLLGMRAPAPDEAVAPPPPQDLPHVPGYRIIAMIARGGMGIVYKAVQLRSGGDVPLREVALKMMALPDGDGENHSGRFLREIAALAELKHPGILPLYESGESRHRLWFTMELASGGSLADLIRERKGKILPRKSASIISAMADAVHYAHSRGVLHRDIKPGNVLFDDHDRPCLADFGLAKMADNSVSMTHTAHVFGTPSYMAPEVATGGARAATTLSDVYSLGAVLYELLSGRPPFVVEGLAALIKKIAEDEPERPSTIVSGISRDLEVICLTCLAKEPARRYPTAAALAEDLRRWQRGEPITARRAGTIDRLRSWVRRRPALAAVSGLLILTLIGSGIWLTVTNLRLHAALTAIREARERSDAQFDFLIGEFGDRLESIGQLKVLCDACEKLTLMDRPEDAEGFKRHARLQLRWGSALWEMGSGKAAASKLRKTMELAEKVFQSDKKDAGALSLWIEARCKLADVLLEIVSFTASIQELDAAASLLGSLEPLNPDEHLRLSARIDWSKAAVFRKLKGSTKEAPTAMERCIATLRQWVARKPDDSSRTIALAKALHQLGSIIATTGNLSPESCARASVPFREAVEILSKVTSRDPDAEFALARSTGWLGDCYIRMPEFGPAAAEPLLLKEYETVKAMTARDPVNRNWRVKLGGCHKSLASLSAASGRPDDEKNIGKG